MTPAQFWQIEMQNQQNREAMQRAERENMQQMTNQVFDALSQFAGQYAQKEGMKRAGKAYKQTLPMFASALGMGDDQLKQFTGMDDLDLYYAMESIRPALPSMINAQLVTGKLGVQQQGQALNSPGARALVSNQQDVINQGGNQIQGARWQRNP